ncbi:HEAT repeat domain-containing protein [Actinoplanes italicus]|uniref:HEAT repeat domain-containing protein n=1 Tax=Actinoplanes italicus TaxID=113567 RepID=UPI0014730041|nr:HEAT repeat domain-containing protein [Actinoplanes italicus]
MDFDVLLERLAVDEPEAERTLVEAGAPAVGPVLVELCDESSAIAWYRLTAVLRRIGVAAFAPLVDALAAAPTPEVARRCRSAFAGLDVPDTAIYRSALRHHSPAVRLGAVHALQRLKARAEPFLPDLVALFEDPDAEVRESVRWACGAIGPAAIPGLRAVRRGSGRARRAALTALADIGGWDALDAADQRAVARLIEVRSPGETPEPMHLCGSWYAVPSAMGQQAVLDAFALTEARPVTMRLGASAWTSDHHNGDVGGHGRCSRMYVTPALNGWTLVFGTVPSVAHIDDEAAFREAVRDHCARLSGRFGVAHWYGASCGDGWTAWCLAEGGTVIDQYDIFEREPPDDDDEPPAADEPAIRYYDDFVPRTGRPAVLYEQLAIDGFGVSLADRSQWARRTYDIPDHAHATDVAARLSVDPGRLGPDITVTGRGLLALTTCGTGRPSVAGALAI